MAWIWPPQRVKRCVVPWRTSALETSRPPWTCVMGGLYHGPGGAPRARRLYLRCCLQDRARMPPLMRLRLVAVLGLAIFAAAPGCHGAPPPRSPAAAIAGLHSADPEARR